MEKTIFIFLSKGLEIFFLMQYRLIVRPVKKVLVGWKISE
jgi:hypothetical protein